MNNTKIQELYGKYMYKGDVITLNKEIIEEIKGEVKAEVSWIGTEKIEEVEDFTENEKEETKREKAINESDNDEFNEIMKHYLKKYNHQVFLKFNGKSLSDVEWMCGTICVTNANTAMMLLQGSERVQHEIYKAEQIIEKQSIVNENEKKGLFELEIREWKECKENSEYRMFIVERELIIVSQRYNDLYNNGNIKEKEKLMNSFVSFYNQIKDISPIDNYIINIMKEDKAIKIISIKELDEYSYDGMLFDEEELMNLKQSKDIEKPIFKFVEESEKIVPSYKQFHGVPEDFMNDEIYKTFLSNPELLSQLTSNK